MQARLWQLMVVAIALVMALPMIVAVAALGADSAGVWSHIVEYVLPRVTVNTLLLVVGVAVLSLLLGTIAAWLTSVFDFPGQRWFAWCLMLPLALPGYVTAFALSGVFEYSSPLAGALRFWGISLPGVSAGLASTLCLTLTLYPYVFLLARQAFLSQGRRSLEVAQSLGMRQARGMWRVALPFARPWLVAGVSLVIMETLADFGTVKVFNFDTFTTAIYSAWFGLFSLTAALQMSLCLLVLVVAALWLERRARRLRRYTGVGQKDPQHRLPLTGGRRWLATCFCGGLFVIAFLVPVGQLVVWAIDYVQLEWSARYWSYLRASVSLATFAAVFVALLSVLLGFGRRRAPGRTTDSAVQVSTLGYALPGTVLAVGFFVALSGVQDGLTAIGRALGAGDAFVVTLTGTLWVMLLAYAARFLAVGFSPVGSGFERISPRIDDTAEILGLRGVKRLRQVYLPLLTPGIATALLLVFVDVMKELPITLITRPFGWDTLSVRIFQMTTEGEWQRASIPALTIVLCGLIPVMILQRQKSNSRGATN
ncbi:MAG: iron ABC transporter permease [Pseudomonadota bacterium]